MLISHHHSGKEFRQTAKIKAPHTVDLSHDQSTHRNFTGNGVVDNALPFLHVRHRKITDNAAVGILPAAFREKTGLIENDLKTAFSVWLTVQHHRGKSGLIGVLIKKPSGFLRNDRLPFPVIVP